MTATTELHRQNLATAVEEAMMTEKGDVLLLQMIAHPAEAVESLETVVHLHPAEGDTTMRTADHAGVLLATMGLLEARRSPQGAVTTLLPPDHR